MSDCLHAMFCCGTYQEMEGDASLSIELGYTMEQLMVALTRGAL